MALEACRAEIRAAAGMDISDEQADRLMDAVLARAETLRRQGAGSEALMQAADEISAEEAAVRARKRLNAVQDMQKREAQFGRVQQLQGAGLPLRKAFDALTRGVAGKALDIARSTASKALAQQNDLLGMVTYGLDRAGLRKAWEKGTSIDNMARELFEMGKEDGKPGVTKDPLALKMANIVRGAQDVAKGRLNRSGAWVGDYEGYIARTLHNAERIKADGFDAWRDFVTARLDWDRTLADVQDDPGMGIGRLDEESGMTREDKIAFYMRGIYDGLSTGVHVTSEGGVGKSAAFAGPGNLAKRVSAERVLHWRDADGWLDYQRKYGEPVVQRGIMESLRRAGRDIALMQDWGTNPQANFDQLMRRVMVENRSDHAAVADLQKAEPRIREEFKHLTGEASRPTNSLSAKVLASVHAWQDITKLPFVLFTHLSVGATKPFQLMFHGVGRWDAYSSVIRALAQDKSPEGRMVAENLAANALGQATDIGTHYDPIDGVPGGVAKLRSLSMRLGGLPWMLGRQRTGTQFELANFLGQRIDRAYAELEPRTQQALGTYGIGAREWDILRSAPDHDRDGDGSTYLTPKAGMRASDEAIDGYAAGKIDGATPQQIERIRLDTREDLAMRLAAYYHEAADRSVVTPGIPERAFWSLHAGKTAGPVLSQYKLWAQAAVRQMWGTAWHGSSHADAVKSLAELVAVGTALGFGRMALTDAIKGKEPRDWKDPRTWMAAMAQGGGMGIFGDYVFGEFDRFGRSLPETLAGPMVGEAGDVLRMLAQLRDAGEQKHPADALRGVGAEAMRKVFDELPFVNVFYIRTLANWLILDRLQEAAQPGYLRRYEQRVKQQTGQTYWLPPSQYAGAR